MQKEIELSSGTLRYELIRKRVKRINLRVRADGSVMVSASRLVPLEVVEDFLRRKEAFLMAAIKKSAERRKEESPCADGGKACLWGEELTLRFEKGGRYRASRSGEILCLYLRSPEDAKARQAALFRWETERCAELAEELLKKWLPLLQPFGAPRPTLRFRQMSSRWGSCMPQKGIVTLNTRLLAFPKACMEYILVHELCHFLQPDHSQRFYVWMDHFLPDWRERKRLLQSK